jgi:hypothetical protein
MPTIISQGAGSAQGFGFASNQNAPVYVEDVFSNYTYTGSGASKTITNAVNLSEKGGLVWIKSISDVSDHFFFDTARGVNQEINSNTSNASVSLADSLTAFNTNGFTVGGAAGVGVNGTNYMSYTFRKQPKFFDIVTYTGNGATQTISHNLGSVPGCIMVKQIGGGTTNWAVYHSSLGNNSFVGLNVVTAATTPTVAWNTTTPTSSNFSVGNLNTVNGSGLSYIAYLFANDSGGFGISGTENIITCGMYTGTGVSGNSVTLGYEPQYVMIRRYDAAGSWYFFDNIRPFSNTATAYFLANTTAASATATPPGITPTATGFVLPTTSTIYNASGGTYLYIAIRRGPMKTPTSATSVFTPVYGAGTTPGMSSSFVVDSSWVGYPSGNVSFPTASSRLTNNEYAQTSGTVAPTTSTNWNYQFNNGFGASYFDSNFIGWLFGRAPGFFDVVCFTTDASGNYTGNHNLGVAPELIITKRRNSTGNWFTYCAYSGTSPLQRWLLLNDVNGASGTGTTWWAASSSSFSVLNGMLAASATNIAYLFASLNGVSKVGSYTGNGSSQTINCGFSSGSRFVLIKRTDSTGNWALFDSTRGIVAGNDPAIYLNSTAAQVTTADAVDTDSSGFIVNQEATINLNVSAASYVYLAIA